MARWSFNSTLSPIAKACRLPFVGDSLPSLSPIDEPTAVLTPQETVEATAPEPEVKAAAAPAKAKRTAPSLTRNLLRIVLNKPQLAAQLPVDLLPETAERQVLIRLHQLVKGAHEAMTYASIQERLRGTPEHAQIEKAAAELLSLPFAEEEAEAEFRDALEKLQEGGQKRDFAELQIKAQQFGVAGLTAEEKLAYIQLLGKQRS